MTARRLFLARFSAAAAALGFGATWVQGAQAPPAPLPPDARWQPARDPKDDWLDQIPGKHRLFFDTVSPQGVREVQAFAGNYFNGSKTGYGLESTDLAVVICLRHQATSFAFTDAIWAKYGAALGESEKFTDPKTGQPPVGNVYKTALEAQVKRGVHFAVCDMSTHRLAGFIARRTDGNADAIYKEMVANAIGNAHFVAAGIIAVNRAQERGYSIAYTG
jgi:hypothetical protein